MSKLTSLVTDAADPDAIRTARRENYQTWQQVLADREDISMFFERLPEGISPYEFPVRARDPDAFLTALHDCGVVGAHTWPILRQSVFEADGYDTATRLSEEVVTLPVHQGIEPAAIEAAGDRLGR